MEVNRLSEDELKYELTIRGYPLVADINIMRDLLRSSLRTNENHLETYVLLDAKDEIFICTAKLRELKETIDNMDGDQSSESFKTVDTKLNHLLARIERITTEDPSLKKQRSILLKTILHLMQESSSKTQNTIVNPTKISIEQYNITPGTRIYNEFQYFLFHFKLLYSTNILHCFKQLHERGSQQIKCQQVRRPLPRLWQKKMKMLGL